jgi:hypothetical protein
MLQRIGHSIFFLLVFIGFNLSSLDLSAQSNRDEPSVGGSSKQTGKSRTYKKARVLMPSTAKKIVKIAEALERQKVIKVPDPVNKGKFIEKEEDDPDWALARKILTELLNN